ncbi:MAG: hypothetical protein IJ061_02235 [Lachnospiraceae bacterium]|nr:hypothetical protein [Lachnospiraceae bacterium]
MKAVVTEIRGTEAAVLTEDGQFLAVPDLDYRIGMELDLPDSVTLYDDKDELSEDELFDDFPEENEITEPVPADPVTETGSRRSPKSVSGLSVRRWRKVLSTAAAAAVLIVGAGGAYTYAQPYGVVSLDAAPSIEYTINRFDRVLSAELVSGNAESFSPDFDLNSLKHTRIDRALELTLDHISLSDPEESSSDESAPVVILGTNTRDGRHSSDLSDRLKLKVQDSVGDIDVYAASISDEEAGRAHEFGTTPGRLHFVRTMLNGEENADNAVNAETAELELKKWVKEPIPEIMSEHKRRRHPDAQAAPFGNTESGQLLPEPGKESGAGLPAASDAGPAGQALKEAVPQETIPQEQDTPAGNIPAQRPETGFPSGDNSTPQHEMPEDAKAPAPLTQQQEEAPAMQQPEGQFGHEISADENRGQEAAPQPGDADSTEMFPLDGNTDRQENMQFPGEMSRPDMSHDGGGMPGHSGSLHEGAGPGMGGNGFQDSHGPGGPMH